MVNFVYNHYNKAFENMTHEVVVVVKNMDHIVDMTREANMDVESRTHIAIHNYSIVKNDFHMKFG